MKQGWEVKKLGDICDVIGGGTPSKMNSKFYDGSILWATVRDMKEDIIKNTEHKITEEAVKGSSTNIIPKGNVIIATRVGLGKVCLIENDTAINQDLRGIIPKKTSILSVGYLYQWFKSISNLIVEEGTGATVQGVKLPFIKDLKIPLPPLSEQQKIVAILDEAFAVIERAKANAEQNLKNAKELFDSYLQSVFENKDEEWEEKMLKEIGVAQTGTTPKTADKENYGDFIPFIKPADIDITGNGTIRYDNDGLSEQGLNNGRKMLEASILMVCIGATIGKVGFVDRDVSCNQQINSLTVKQELFPKFVYYALSTKGFFEQVMHNAAQATLPIINKGKWEILTISYPKSKTEQQKIVQKLDLLSAETKRLEAIYQQKIDNLEELKKSILQKAFNGEL